MEGICSVIIPERLSYDEFEKGFVLQQERSETITMTITTTEEWEKDTHESNENHGKRVTRVMNLAEPTPTQRTVPKSCRDVPHTVQSTVVVSILIQFWC